MTQRLVIPATIKSVEERFTMHWVSGVGDKAVFETRSTGWWIVIDKIALYVGPDKPDFAEGELIKLSIEKAR